MTAMAGNSCRSTLTACRRMAEARGGEQRSVILMDVRPNLIRSRPHRQRTGSMYE